MALKTCKGTGRKGREIRKGMNSKPSTAECPVCHYRKSCDQSGTVYKHYAPRAA